VNAASARVAEISHKSDVEIGLNLRNCKCI